MFFEGGVTALHKRYTVQDIAKRAGVTAATVSMALNNKQGVSAETKQRIVRIANELGYIPNISARALVQQRTYTLGLFIPSSPSAFLDSYFSNILRGITEVATKAGYLVSIVYEDSVHEHLTYRVDGLILTELKGRDPYVDLFRKFKIPFVSMGKVNDTLPSVDIDTQGGIMQAVKYLVSLGHRKIGFIAGPPKYHYVVNRYRSFKKALHAHGLPLEADWMSVAPNSRAGGRQAVVRLLKRVRGAPTAFLVCTDLMTVGVIDGLKDLGLDVPHDVSVIGFDDAPYAELVQPPLTTIRQDVYLSGKYAARMLIDTLEGKQSTVSVTLPVRLVRRKSTSTANDSKIYT